MQCCIVLSTVHGGAVGDSLKRRQASPSPARFNEAITAGGEAVYQRLRNLTNLTVQHSTLCCFTQLSVHHHSLRWSMSLPRSFPTFTRALKQCSGAEYRRERRTLRENVLHCSLPVTVPIRMFAVASPSHDFKVGGPNLEVAE